MNGLGGSGGHRDLVHFVCAVPRTLVYPLDGLGTWCFGEAEHVAGLGVGPGVLEVDVLVTLMSRSA